MGADLTRAGFDTVLIDQWPEHVDRMKSHGVTVEMPSRTEVTPVRALHLCELARTKERYDVVLVMVKAYDTRWACELIRPYLADDALVVGLQNGMTTDDIASVLGAGHAVGCVVEVTSALWEPGHVERHTPPEGSWFGLSSTTHDGSQTTAAVAAMLQAAGAVEVVVDIARAKWMKLIVNAGELVTSAILDLPLHAALELPGMPAFAAAVAQEAAETAVALGHELAPIFGLTSAAATPAEHAQQLLDAVVGRFSLPHTKTTVLQDWTKGRKSEARELNGYVVEMAGRAGIATPLNARTLRLALEIEAGERPFAVSNASALINGSEDE